MTTNNDKKFTITIISSIVISFVICLAIYKTWSYYEQKMIQNAAAKSLSEMTMRMEADRQFNELKATQQRQITQAKQREREGRLRAEREQKELIRKTQEQWELVQDYRSSKAKKIGSDSCQFWTDNYNNNPNPKTLKKRNSACGLEN